MAYNYDAYPFGRWLKWAIIGLLVLIILFSCISKYNGLVAADQDVKMAWSQVENVMQRRLDLIPNLVETVKGYVKHEEKVFGDIAQARSILMNSGEDIKSKTEADIKLSKATRDLMVLVENYPDLKSNQQFHDLQIAIEGAENRVSVERKNFIKAVQAYNLKVTRFPGKIFARLMGFSPMDYYEADKAAQEAPKVQF